MPIETDRIRVRDFALDDAGGLFEIFGDDETTKNCEPAYAFAVKNAHKIFAEAIDGVKSVGLMKKLGMRLEGIQRAQTLDNAGNLADLYFYGILREDWKARR